MRRGAAESDEYVYCTILASEVRPRIMERNRYVDRTLPSLWEMRQIAWVLRTDSKRRQVGFVRSKDWARLHEDEDLLPPHLR